MPEHVSADNLSRRPLFLAACAAMFVFGIVLALLGTLFGLPETRARLQADLARQGDLFLLLYLGLAAATVVVGPLIDRIGNKLVLICAALLVTAALGGFVAARSYAAAVVSAVALGVGGSGLNTAANVLVSDLYGAQRGPRLNLLGIFYGGGALAIPLLVASVSAILTVGQLLLFAVALSAAAAAAYALLQFPPARESRGFAARELAQVARYPGVMLLAAVLFCESGNEASIGGWTSSYLGTMGASAHAATWVLAGYWAALMAGRLLASRLLETIRKEQLVLLSGIGSAAGCAVLLAARSLAGMAAGVALAGLSFAAVYPTTLAMAGDRYPRFSGTLFGLLFAVGITGGMLFPWAIGHLSPTFGMRAALLLPVGSAGMICALMAIFRGRNGGGQARPDLPGTGL